MSQPIDSNRPPLKISKEDTAPNIVPADGFQPKTRAKHTPHGMPPKHPSPLAIKPALPPRSKELLKQKIVLLKQKYVQIQHDYEQTEIPHKKIACYVHMKNIKNQISYIQAEDAMVLEECSPIIKTIYKGFTKASEILNPFDQPSRPGSTSAAGTFPFNPLTYVAALSDTVSFFSDLYRLVKTSRQLQIITNLEKKEVERLDSIAINIRSERLLANDQEKRGESRAEADRRIENMEKERGLLLTYLKPLADLKKQVDLSHTSHRLAVGATKMGLSYLDVAHAIIGFASIFVIAESMMITGLSVSGLSVLLTGALVAVDFFITRANLKNAAASLHNLQFLSQKFRESAEKQWKKLPDIAVKKVSQNSVELFENTVAPYLQHKLQVKITEQWFLRAADVLVIAATAAAVVTTILAVTGMGSVVLPFLAIPVILGISSTALLLSAPFLAEWIAKKQSVKIPTQEEFEQKLFKQIEEEQNNWNELVRNDLHYHTNTYVIYNLVKNYYSGGLNIGLKNGPKTSSSLNPPMPAKRSTKPSTKECSTTKPDYSQHDK